MVDISGYLGTFASFGKSGLFWTIGGAVVLIIVFFFYCYMSRRGKLKYNCIELVRFGNGKVGVNLLTAGVFKNKSMFGGMIDYGTKSIFRTKDGRRILGAKTEMLHDIFGKKGFFCIRKGNDQKVLVVVDKMLFDNLQVLMRIAPGDFTDASVDIFKDATKETTGMWEKIVPYIAIGLVVILCIITVVINQQMTNNTIDKVGKMLIQGCQNAQVAQPGTSP